MMQIGILISWKVFGQTYFNTSLVFLRFSLVCLYEQKYYEIISISYLEKV